MASQGAPVLFAIIGTAVVRSLFTTNRAARVWVQTQEVADGLPVRFRGIGYTKSSRKDDGHELGTGSLSPFSDGPFQTGGGVCGVGSACPECKKAQVFHPRFC